ncbi:hypothetical protein BV20DRAFT_545538 [Pilatotrama ljubarskyi]|nr:hypothetical protein BV20DRAFT_545538 [Pilatotrama ljubarskyi]
MTLSPSFEDLAAWEDLNILVSDEDDDPSDPRRMDPRQLPPEIVELDKSIADLEAQLGELKLKRSRLLDERALISHLPPEIMSRIFELGVDESLELLPVLSLVSHRWRDIVLACPSLWTYIVLDSDWGWRIPAFLRKVRAHLKRSQASKLFVDIDFRYVESFVDAQVIMAELEPHLSRCYSFTVSVPDWSRMRIVQEHASELGPALEDLYLRIDASESEVEDPFCVLTQPCPRLTHVMLEHAPLECVGVPMPSLRQLYLLRDHRCHSSSRIAYPFKGLMSIATASPLKWLNIRSAVFNLDSTEEIFKANPALSELPLLKGLSFDVVDSASISLFLESTSLPALSLLSVNSGDDIHWLTRIALSPQRYPSLRLLDLRNFNFNGVGLAPFVRALHHLPQLTGLGLTSPASGVVGGRLFEVLAASPDTVGEWLLPRLEALCIQNCPDISGHELLRVVTSRRGAAAVQVAKISYLKISQCYLLDPEALERLTALVDTVRTL